MVWVGARVCVRVGMAVGVGEVGKRAEQAVSRVIRKVKIKLRGSKASALYPPGCVFIVFFLSKD
jgi:hypothetical protein